MYEYQIDSLGRTSVTAQSWEANHQAAIQITQQISTKSCDILKNIKILYNSLQRNHRLGGRLCLITAAPGDHDTLWFRDARLLCELQVGQSFLTASFALVGKAFCVLYEHWVGTRGFLGWPYFGLFVPS